MKQRRKKSLRPSRPDPPVCKPIDECRSETSSTTSRRGGGFQSVVVCILALISVIFVVAESHTSLMSIKGEVKLRNTSDGATNGANAATSIEKKTTEIPEQTVNVEVTLNEEVPMAVVTSSKEEAPGFPAIDYVAERNVNATAMNGKEVPTANVASSEEGDRGTPVVDNFTEWKANAATTSNTEAPIPESMIVRPQIIPKNEASSYVKSDVSKIVRVPGTPRIEVHLKAKSVRKCQNPLLRGRISGWSLSLIDFAFERNDTNVLVGNYDLSTMPIPGKYYVEIIILSCELYNSTSFDADLRDVCPYHHTGEGSQVYEHEITQRESTIDIAMGTEVLGGNNQNRKHNTGRWVHKDLVNINDTQPRMKEELPPQMHTRTGFKDHGWRNDHSKFFNYTYQWGKERPLLPQYGNNIPAPKTPLKICFLGSSHSRELNTHCRSVLAENPGIVFDCNHVQYHFPMNMTKANVRRFGQGCTHAVVGVFQWYFSYENLNNNVTGPITFSGWKTEMRKAVQNLKELACQEEFPLRKIILRSAHANSRQMLCPMDDFRTVPNADMASSILKDISEDFLSSADNDANGEAIVSFLDTRFLMNPVWDSAGDTSHFRWAAGLREAEFIVSEILREEGGKAI